MSIAYTHLTKEHSVAGARAALPIVLAHRTLHSLLDVGCGTGTWLKAAIECGITDVIGVDGVRIEPAELQVPAELIRHFDLTKSWSLERRFDVAICLEVAEHLDPTSGPSLIRALANHSDLVLFSAACPGQPGQHHVNCRWPSYWQSLFNECGYVCEDDLRAQIWDDPRIEPWYRQNLFLARRDPESAGNELRIHSLVHPAMWKFESGVSWAPLAEHLDEIENGSMPITWYMTVPAKALWAKIARKVQVLR